MKRILLLVLVGVFLCVGSAGATLITSNGVVFDDVSNLYWFEDVSYFTNQTYYQVLLSIDELNAQQFGGISSWGLASAAQWTLLDDNGLTELYHTFTNTAPYYTEGRTGFALQPDTVLTRAVQESGWRIGSNYYHVWSDDDVGAWVVSEQAPAPVPEPTTILLFGTGLIGLAGIRRKKSMK